MKVSTSALAACGLASITLAQLAHYSPQNGNGASYSVNIPSAAASSGSGDIYFQIQAPASLQWVGLGQGDQMAGSNIFIIYADASGSNVSLSPRLGTGHVQPNYDTQAQVFLLEGSGIANNVMTANVRCANCATWSGGSMDFSSPRSNWIWAVKEGSPIKSDSKSADLSQHNSMSSFTFDLTKARGGSSLNPFISSTSSATGSASSGAASVATAPTTVGSSSDSSSAGSSSSSSESGSLSTAQKAKIAHGTIMGLAFVLFLPLGSVLIRVCSFPGAVWIHVSMQAFAYLCALVGLGLGIYVAINPEDILNMYHPIIGLVVLGCLLIQPILGYIHHIIYARTGKPTMWAVAHVWFGRIIITLGIINGGLGLRFAHQSTKAKIAYGVVAGVVWLSWVVVAIWAVAFKNRGVNQQGGEKKGYRDARDEAGVSRR